MNTPAPAPSAQALTTGLVAGLVCALMAGSVLTQSSLSVLLFLLSPVPVLAAGLGFGAASSLVAAIIAVIAVSLGVQYLSGAVLALTSAIPAAWAAWMLGLARPADEVGGKPGEIVWFPFADVLFRTAFAIATGFVVIGVMIGYSQDFAVRFAELFAEQMQAVNPEFQPSADFAPSFAGFLYAAVPVIQPAMMMAAMLASIHIALKIARAMGRAARPGEDWPTVLRMPRAALAVFGLALAASFFSGPVGLVGLAYCGALGMGFVIAGLAATHLRSRGKPGRAMLLGLIYLGLFVFLPLIVVFLVIGLFDTSRAAPVSKPKP